MSTSMKKVEVYSTLEKCPEVVAYLEEEKLYWYKHVVELAGPSKVCHVTFYAPIHALVNILERLAKILDLRRKENAIMVLDVETGIGRPYQVTGKRFRHIARSVLARPIPAILEEAMEKSTLYPAQTLLVLLASIIALAGLSMNNPYVIIGAMLISPILAPIYSFAVSITVGDKRIAARSLGTLGSLIAAGFLASLVVSLVARLAGEPIGATREILLRTQPTILDLLLALVLGSASIIAVSSNVTEALTGVAIAAAIVPPTATLGWTVVHSVGLAWGTLVTIAVNIIGLLAGGSLTVQVLLYLSKNNSKLHGRNR